MPTNKFTCLILTIVLFSSVIVIPVSARPVSTIYYVSSSSGKDTNNGLSTGAPFATIAKINSLSLQPGDQVLLKCGDLWQADPLIISQSGTQTSPIYFGSYPIGCNNKPILSGSRLITGWTLDSGNIYRATLPTADFPYGINQLFRGGVRLTMGRWPNIDSGNGGYSFVTAHSSGSNQITDSALPPLNWTGAIIHIKNIRWSMLDRQVTASNGTTLTLNQGLSCLVESWGDCTGWGFFINNSKNTLDQDGEWYYDVNSQLVYLFSTGGIPSNIEGSVVLSNGSSDRGAGIMLSDGSATGFIVLDNLQIQNWYNDGIGTPGGMFGDIYHDITVSNSIIKDVNAEGVNLSSWLERPSNGRKGLRGGYNLLLTNNIIDGANDFGITGYFAASTFRDNVIENIALVKNLTASGMGCGLTSNECTENGDGFRIRLFDVRDSGFNNTLQYNLFDKIGYNGIDVFGPNTLLENNYIHQSCFTKADCGGVRTFGDTSLATTTVYNLHLIGNIINDIPGNVDGCPPSRAAFGMGLYIDNYSRDVESRGNTIINTTVSGILYQQSSGQIIGNTVFNASSGTEYSAQIDVSGSAASVAISNNVMYGLKPNAWTLYVNDLNNIQSSDQNYFFQPYVNQNIAYGPSWTRVSFAQWQSLSGQDQGSKTNWFTQPSGQASRATVFYNNAKIGQTINLGGRQYLTLDQQTRLGTLILNPFTSVILVDNGPAPLTLTSTIPGMFGANHPVDFILTVYGAAFTPASVVRWSGSNRPTIYLNNAILTATISASDVSVPGNYPIKVWDPLPTPNGTETGPVIFRVFPQVYGLFLPLSSR